MGDRRTQLQMETALSNAAMPTQPSQKRKRTIEVDDDLPEKRVKFDAKKSYLLCNSRARERNLALAKLRSLEKKPTSNLDVLPDDCVLQIMHHLGLSKDLLIIDSITSSLLCFMKSTNRVNDLWNRRHRSILAGMQEKRYPQFLDMFGRVGQETDEQIRNLSWAITTESERCADASGVWWRDPLGIVHVREIFPHFYKLHMLNFLEHVTQTLEHHYTLCKEAGFKADQSRRKVSEHTTKRALLTLWTMSWIRVDFEGQGSERIAIEARPEVDNLLHLFERQPEEVRSCITDLLLFVGDRVGRGLQLESRGQLWAENYCKARDATSKETDEVQRWERTASNGVVVWTIILEGIGDAIKLGLRHYEPNYDVGDFILSTIDGVHDIKPAIDEGALGGHYSSEFERLVQLRKGLGNFDIFQKT